MSLLLMPCCRCWWWQPRCKPLRLLLQWPLLLRVLVGCCCCCCWHCCVLWLRQSGRCWRRRRQRLCQSYKQTNIRKKKKTRGGISTLLGHAARGVHETPTSVLCLWAKDNNGKKNLGQKGKSFFFFLSRTNLPFFGSLVFCLCKDLISEPRPELLNPPTRKQPPPPLNHTRPRPRKRARAINNTQPATLGRFHGHGDVQVCLACCLSKGERLCCLPQITPAREHVSGGRLKQVSVGGLRDAPATDTKRNAEA